ncbi:hypothetical protein, partial [Shinella sp. SUS2]|uniref:hypothetical protein n=1 Tax=Shinella sp. SUS2 TaxID=1692241 RepID=UPI001AEBF799
RSTRKPSRKLRSSKARKVSVHLTTDKAAKLTGFTVRNYMGVKSVAVLQWEKGKSGGSIHIELTADQCLDLSVRLLDQARILMLERPTSEQ